MEDKIIEKYMAWITKISDSITDKMIIITITILNILDFITTETGLRLGYQEINPLYSTTVKILIIILLILLLFYKREQNKITKLYDVIITGLLIAIPIYIYVVINNIIVIT